MTGVLVELETASPAALRGVGLPVIYDITADADRLATQADLDAALRVARLAQQWMKARKGPSGELAAVARGEMSEQLFADRYLRPKKRGRSS